MNLNIFLLFDGALMLVGLPILMNWKGKKVYQFSTMEFKDKMLLAWQNLRLAYEDQEEINIHIYYIKIQI